MTLPIRQALKDAITLRMPELFVTWSDESQNMTNPLSQASVTISMTNVQLYDSTERRREYDAGLDENVELFLYRYGGSVDFRIESFSSDYTGMEVAIDLLTAFDHPDFVDILNHNNVAFWGLPTVTDLPLTFDDRMHSGANIAVKMGFTIVRQLTGGMLGEYIATVQTIPTFNH